ncbi:MAG: right-handed parallel beta-helix repeat-containing protein, partial [bacterium]
GFEAWYPNVALLPDNRPVFTWSQHSADRVTIRTLESSVFAAFLADKTSGNSPLTVTFSDYSGFDIISRNWDFGDGEESTEKNPVHQYTIPGVYTVSLTVANDAGSDTKIIQNYITVKEASFIQSAIDNAEDGEVIVLPEGIYYETINFMGKAITLQSTNPNNPEVIASTIIDGYESGSVVTFDKYEGAASALNGITIQNGKAWGGREYGGGIYCFRSSPTITNCIISGNFAVNKNSAFGYGIGGGIYCGLYSSPTINHCRITGNCATDTGGIYCDYSSSATITNCLVSDNYASKSGGGGTLLSSAVSVKNCIIRNNISEDGGGLYCRNSPHITNCLIYGNHASASGGIHIKSNSTPLIMNCTITGNSSATEGGGMYFPYPAPYPVFTNCIIWGNFPDEINGNIAITYSDIRGGFEGEGNISADPMFADPLSGCYALQPDSPCIDKGTDQYAPNDDIKSFPRPSGNGYDMGAYEYDSSPYFYNLKLDPGWSMISLPVIPNDSTIGILFPQAEAVYRYRDEYVFMSADEELQKGEGYWIFVPEACDCNISGTPFYMYSIENVQPGWSMIGSCTSLSNVSAANGTINAVFGFDKGYSYIGKGNNTGPLSPGEGYWINLSGKSDITVRSE